MRRIPWDILLALLIGVGAGLVYSWSISPLRVVDSHPSELHADFKDAYRSAIAAAYAANGNLPRAQARLSLLEDASPVDALNAQAQRMLGSSDVFEQPDKVAELARALRGDQEDGLAIPTPTEARSATQVTPTPQLPPSPADMPIMLTETPLAVETQATLPPPTSRPSDTPAPTLGTPFALTGEESLCDTNLPDGLLQVTVLNSNRRQMPGMKIVMTWDGGDEQFFTGLKPELGNGYADYIMTPNIAYTVQLAQGSDIAIGIIAPTCQAPDGQTFLGGIKLTFQQP